MKSVSPQKGGSKAAMSPQLQSVTAVRIPTGPRALSPSPSSVTAPTPKVLSPQRQNRDVAIVNAKKDSQDYDYEVADDFEEYDEEFEEFEDDDGGHAAESQVPYTAPLNISEVRRAMDEENERASSRQNHRTVGQKNHSNRESIDPSSSAGHDRAVLPARKELQLGQSRTSSKILSRQIQRAKDLKSLVEFDIAVYEIFDLAPMNEYDLYIRNFGHQNTRQVHTQWNEDSIDTEGQTDDWAVEDKWTQAPPENFVDCGAGQPEYDWMKEEAKAWAKADRRAGKADFPRGTATSATVQDSVSLIIFLRNASQVLESLLEENARGIEGGPLTDHPASIEISEGLRSLKLPSFLSGRRVSHTEFSPIDHRILVTAWTLPTGPFATSKLGKRGIVCLWTLSDPSAPLHVLSCEGEPTTATICSTKSHLVLAGTADGGVVLWDLREPSSLHSSYSVNNVVVRTASYCTDALFSIDSLHRGKVVNVVPLIRSQSLNSKILTVSPYVMELEMQQAFQVASIDEMGFVQLWILIEGHDNEYNRVSENDFGLAIGSQVKLQRGTSFIMKETAGDISTRKKKGTVVQCRFRPNDIDHFIIGLDTGRILNQSRFRDNVFPRTYDHLNTSHFDVLASDPVASLDFNRFTGELFLATYNSGTVALFHSDRHEPLIVWTLRDSIPALQVLWSPHRPSVFYVLDIKANLHIWDLMADGTGPIHVTDCSEAGSGANVTQMALSPAITADIKSGSVNSGSALLVIAFDDGEVEVHSLVADLREQNVDELRQFSQIYLPHRGE